MKISQNDYSKKDVKKRQKFDIEIEQNKTPFFNRLFHCYTFGFLLLPPDLKKKKYFKKKEPFHVQDLHRLGSSH